MAGPRAAPGLLVVPLLTVVLVWTSPLHGLMRQEASLALGGPFPVLSQTWGPWYWVHTAYSSLLNLSSLVLTARSLGHPVPLYRRLAWALLTGLGFVVGVDLLYDLQVWPPGWGNPTPVALGLGVLPVAWAIFRYRLFDVVPIARAAVVERMGAAVAVLDQRNRVLDLNPTAERLLGCSAAHAAGRPVEEVFAAWPDLAQACLDETVSRRAWMG